MAQGLTKATRKKCGCPQLNAAQADQTNSATEMYIYTERHWGKTTWFKGCYIWMMGAVSRAAWRLDKPKRVLENVEQYSDTLNML